MPTAKNVADYILTLVEEDAGDLMSNLKLQKIVYYAQGFHLAIHDKPLFDEDIEAWQHGPVVPSLYREYKDHGSGPIPVPEDPDLSALTKEQRELLNEVYNYFGQFSAWKLRNMTHQEAPWKKNWDKAQRGVVIPKSEMKQFFETMVE